MRTDHILVSVIMCVYNTRQEYLNEAVKSILNQTHWNFELFIVDDCSEIDLYQDDIFKDARITLLKNDANYGPAYSRNRALAFANGKYIAIMDSDDISLPTRLEEQVIYMEEHDNVVACGTWYQHIGAKTNTVSENIDDKDYYRCCLLFANAPALLNPSAMIRASALFDNNIKYDEELRIGEDYKMWVELSLLGTVINIHKVLVQYRVHEGQSTKDNNKKKQSLIYDAKVKRMQLELISNNFSEEEKKLFVLYYGDKKVNIINYYNLLTKICHENEISHFFEQNMLEKRVLEQWRSKILCTNNPFILLKAMLTIKGQGHNIMKIKTKQLTNKLFKTKKYR